MAGSTVCVVVGEFTLEDLFDSKLAGKAVDKLKAGAAKAIEKSGKLSSDKPKDKNTPRWTLGGTLGPVAPDKAGRKLEGKLTLSAEFWGDPPRGAAKARASAFTDIRGADKVRSADVEALAEALMEAAMKQAVKVMEAAAA